MFGWLWQRLLNLRPWVVTVTRNGKIEIFAEFWRESEARRTYRMASQSKGFSDEAPPVYHLWTRSEWNALASRAS